MNMKFLNEISIIFAFCVSASTIAVTRPKVDATLYVDTDVVLSRNAMGFGFQWDPSDIWDYTDAQWRRIYRRVDFMKPQFIRCCLTAYHYCKGFDTNGEPIYDWNSPAMKRLEPILDYCQKRHVTVLLGEWGAPFGMKWEDPRWSRLIGDCLDHLIRRKGYSCIRYYNLINEPRGDWETYLTWIAAQRNLHAELAKRKLQVKLVGPDHSEGKTAIEWVDFMLKKGSGLFGAYETHWYAGSDSEIPDGAIETTLREARRMVSARDSEGKRKPFFMGEAGTGEWLDGKDSNRYIHDFAYGVFMSDYAAQTMRAGLDGVSAWMLDDPMHQQPGSYPSGGIPGHDPQKDFDFKVWGFWNSLGSAMGKPEEENLRPWFYSWSLLTRLFPRGSNIIACTDPRLTGVRLSAAIAQRGAGQDLSLIVVNDATAPRRFRLAVPNAKNAVNLTEYRYFKKERPTDANGFPVPYRRIHGARLATGLEVNLPTRGVLFLTTREGGTSLRLGEGARPPVTYVEIRDPHESAALGSTLRLVAETDPPGRPIKWSVTKPDGSPADLAVIDQNGALRAKKIGEVRVIAKSGQRIASRTVELTRNRQMMDPLNDWSETLSHTGNWAFDFLHAQFFDGDKSRAKRMKDTPESIVYRRPHLLDFAAKTYFIGDLSGKVRFLSSPDNARWIEIETRFDAPVATGGGFKRTVIRPVRMPKDANYLKIEFSNDAVVWSPQLAEIRLVSAGQ